MRIVLGLEYDGSQFLGWQRQKSGITIQSVVEDALTRVADHPVSVVCAGRTDTAVHASYQVIHFDTHNLRSAHSWVLGTNSNMPPTVSVLWAQPIDESFHARFSATARSYRYIILNRKSKPALFGRRVTWCSRPLNVERMQQASIALLGQHDFTSYRALHCQAKSPMRIIHSLSIKRHGDFIYLDIRADGFLYHMVRNIAGVLMAIAQGDKPVAWADEVLQKLDRTQGGMTAPPYGLYLTKVEYPEEFHLPPAQSLPVFN